ncbi:MFS transporter [Cupriavidus sp. AU9028]|uniref:MFS transporter n=1 Tax=Cupriavidus sp. AU9028 TaxID=2871157 RepID=UPI001C984B35|nr:MFS transporter [Cupriavidus sp. AU9028]
MNQTAPLSPAQAAMPAQDELAGVYRKISLRILPFLLLCYVFAYLDRVNIGFAKLQMQQDVGLSDAIYGLGAGIFFLGYVMFEVPSNLLLARIGARRTISRIMVLWGITSACMLFVHDATSFYVLRFLLGVFEAGFAPGMIFYLTYWYGGARMARVMAVVMLAGPIGGMAGGPVSTWLMTALAGAHGLAGWQWMFLVEGLPCVLLGAIAYFYLDDKPAQARWLTDRERKLLADDIGATQAGGHHSFRTVLRDPRIYALAFGYFCLISGIYAVSFWLPTILKGAGVTSTLAIGMYSAVPYVAAAVFMFVFARSSDRHQERRWHSAMLAFVGAGTLAAAAMTADNLMLSLVTITVATASMWAAYTVFWAIPSEYLKGTAAAGGIALINSIGLLGGFVSPTLIGYVKELTGSMEGGLLSMVVLLVAGGIVILANRLPARSRSASLA